MTSREERGGSKSRRALWALAVALPLGLAGAAGALGACASTASPDDTVGEEESGAPVGAPCVLTTDCMAGLLCGYPEDGGCAAQGICVKEDLACTQDGPTVCACDGTPIGLACIYGVGYAVAPIASLTPGCEPDVDASFD